jgi:hypothetical protein
MRGAECSGPPAWRKSLGADRVERDRFSGSSDDNPPTGQQPTTPRDPDGDESTDEHR